MQRSREAVLITVVVLCGKVALPAQSHDAVTHPQERALHAGWALQSSCKVREPGEVISSRGFRPHRWYTTSVPSTVFAAQVAAGEFPDPYFGMNLRGIPGMSYPIGDNFSNLPMPANSPYACSWWYRTRFVLPRSYARPKVALHFKGINYRANIWLNGRRVGDSDQVAGAFRTYEFDVTPFLHPGENVLAVETFAPTEKDLGITWVDWNPAPPDKDMGLWGDVYLSASGPVTVRHPQVVTHFPDASLNRADLTIMADVRNLSPQRVSGTFEAVVDQTRLQQLVTLQPGESRSLSFTPEQFAALRVTQPKLWWPREMGTPNLHNLTVRFRVGASVSDEQRIRFGIREITSELTDKGYRLFRVNGKRILIRGGGWASDMMLRHSRQRLEDQFRYVVGMNLNTIRLEGKLETDDFYDLADQYGILVMAGWCCCDMWEKWDQWIPETQAIATESLRSQILRLRSHPSLLVWLNGSDNPPPATVETAYINLLKELSWPNPYISSASQTPTTVTGPSGVKMTGPYDYEPPSYWLLDTKFGGAYGFNTETSPGPAIPVAECIRRFVPKDHLWPFDEYWGYHAGGERFQKLTAYDEGMRATYGPPANWMDYTVKSQTMAYDGERAMFEAYARNKYTSTGVIQWMLNNAWPSLIWHLYDYYLQPGGGYFGTRKANEPLHVQYSYDDRSIVVVNSLQQRFTRLSVAADVYDFNLKPLFSRETKVEVDADGTARAFVLPPFPAEPNPAVYFVKLALRDSSGELVSSNFYWLPARLSDIAFDKTTDTNITPVATWEDMTMLKRLPKVRLQAVAEVAGGQVRVRLRNPSKNLAFQVRVAVKQGGTEILPVLWDDNYVALLPGESTFLTAAYPSRRPPGTATLVVNGWNIAPVTVPLKVSRVRASKYSDRGTLRVRRRDAAGHIQPADQCH